MNVRKGLPLALAAVLPAALAIAGPRRGAKKPPKKTTTPAKTDAPAEPAKTDPVTPPTDQGRTDGPNMSGTATTPPVSPPATPAVGTTPPAGAGSGSAAPTPDTRGDAAETPATSDADVDTLRQEYLSLRDELFKSRARANTVASQLYSTRIQIKLNYTTARYYNPAKASIRLDGASVFEDAAGGIAGDDNIRFDGYVAPGRHLVTFHVEATGKDDDSFTSVTETQIVVKAVAGKDLVVTAHAHDSGDIAYEWKRKEKGSYGLGIDVGVKTEKRDDAKGKK